jgi:hypothetical protein
VARVIAGLESYARAEKASEERQWELAAKAFSAAKQSLREASEAYALSPKLASQAQMWQLLVETLVEPARNRCRRLQDVWANFDQFKEGMAKIARAAGATEITQTSIVESTAQSQLQSRIDIQVSLVNEFEDRTRHALNDLRAAIEAAPADEKARKAVLTELEKVIAGPAHETGFFDRFKRFSSNSAEVIANMAKVAAPVATAWNIFAPFFGLPVLPLPMK